MKAEHPYIHTMTPPALMTADQLERLGVPNKRTELVKGRLVVREPAGFRHGEVAGKLFLALARFVEANNSGLVLAAETGFRLESDPDTVRAADVTFIRSENVPVPKPRGFAAMAPDLVVEVLSPDDSPGEVLAKVADWLSAGCRLVWVVDPVRRVARVYRADGTEAILAEGDTLDGEDVLSGFSCGLTSVL